MRSIPRRQLAFAKPVEIFRAHNARIPNRHTSAADDDERFTESQYHVYDKPSVETDGCQGYILMSSNIVFYD